MFVPITIGLFVFGLFIYFIIKYLIPAVGLFTKLEQAKDAVQKLDVNSNSNKSSLKAYFADGKGDELKHAWGVYEDTLHDLYGVVDGQDEPLGSKSTASSGYFFSQVQLVDTPLQVEFFKHLPGLMTGIGIIGTFAGLLLGLSQFDPAGDPSQIQTSLKSLLGGVSEAFIASGIAIFMAMLVTALEKIWLRKCYEQLEALTKAIDNLFSADKVGEEYLSKLVKTTEENGSHVKHIKENLISELQPVLQNMLSDLLDKNHAHQQQAFTAMATQIGQSITDTLQAPLEKIASSVQQVSGDQGTAVQDLLTDVLSAFMTRLETTFGSQMTGMSEMMAQSVDVMKGMQDSFKTLIGDMSAASEESSKVLEQQMMGLLTQVDDKINTMMSNMAQKQIEQDRNISENQQALHQKTTGMLDGLSVQTKQMLEESLKAIQSNRETMEQLTQLSTSSITGMNEGAEKMRLAAERFTTAGQSLSSITEKSSELMSQVNTLSGTLATTSTQLRTLVSDYQQSRDQVTQAIHTLETLIETAKTEAGMSSQMLNEMQQMTTKFQVVSQDTQAYLGKVNDVLVTSFNSFGNSVEASLVKSLGTFDNTLDQAVKRLLSGVEGLNDVAEELTDITQRYKK